MIQRNIITDRYIVDLAYIRKHFKDNARTDVEKYFPFQDSPVNPIRKMKWKNLLVLRSGGLVETVTLMNSMIVGIAGSGWVLFAKLQSLQNYSNFFATDIIYYIVITFVICYFIAWFIQFYLIKSEYKNAREKRKKEIDKREWGMHYEKEDSLIICSEETNISNLELMNELKSWQIFNSRFYLKDCGEILIHDMYFDTEDKNFQRKKISFRIREINNNKLITVKIPILHQLQESKSFRNDEEIETEWSKVQLIKIIQELEKRALYTSLKKIDNIFFDEFDVIGTMRELGFLLIQNRNALRTIKNLVKLRNKEKILVEMAIEQVIFHIGNHNIYHYDIEIEEKNFGSGDARFILSNELLTSKYGKMLIAWKYGKIALGKGLELLLNNNQLQNKSNLTRDDYERIKKLIQNNQI